MYVQSSDICTDVPTRGGRVHWQSAKTRTHTRYSSDHMHPRTNARWGFRLQSRTMSSNSEEQQPGRVSNTVSRRPTRESFDIGSGAYSDDGYLKDDDDMP